MFKYEVGQTIDEFRNHKECVYFDIDDAGATMLVFFKNPTANEIEQFKSEKSFEIRFTELYGVIAITAKIGNLNWMDALYTPHLSKNLTRIQLPDENQGLNLLLILVDAITGEVKHLRILGLSTKFSRRLLGAVMEEITKEFDEEKYNNAINRIYSSYQTKQIVKLSKDYCKFNEQSSHTCEKLHGNRDEI